MEKSSQRRGKLIRTIWQRQGLTLPLRLLFPSLPVEVPRKKASVSGIERSEPQTSGFLTSGFTVREKAFIGTGIRLFTGCGASERNFSAS